VKTKEKRKKKKSGLVFKKKAYTHREYIGRRTENKSEPEKE